MICSFWNIFSVFLNCRNLLFYWNWVKYFSVFFLKNWIVFNWQMLIPRTFLGRPQDSLWSWILKILFDHPEDVLKWRPGDVLIWRPRNVTGPPQYALRMSPRWPWKLILGTMSGHLLNVPKFPLIFFRKLLDWLNLPKSN